MSEAGFQSRPTVDAVRMLTVCIGLMYLVHVIVYFAILLMRNANAFMPSALQLPVGDPLDVCHWAALPLATELPNVTCTEIH